MSFREPPQHRPMLRDGERMLVDDAWRQYFLDLGRAIQGLRDGGSGMAPKWVSGDAYAVDDVVWSPENQLQYICTAASSGSTDPSEDTSKWTLFGSSKIRHVLRGWAVMGAGTNTLTIAFSPALLNQAKTEVRLLGFYSAAASSSEPYDGSVLLASSAALTFNRTTISAFTTTFHWEITEWW